MKREEVVLADWKFALGEKQKCLENAKEASPIHTWNVEEGSEDTWGTGWYEHRINFPTEWRGKRIWVCFHGVYHNAVVFCNGEEVGRHENSGFTPFTVELTRAIHPGADNQLIVKVDSSYSKDMLPFMRSFDWANDGGMIREAHLYVTGQTTITSVNVTAHPLIEQDGIKQEKGAAELAFSVNTDGSEDSSMWLEWQLDSDIESKECILADSVKVTSSIIEQEKKPIQNVKYWHFDQPNLYTLTLRLLNQDGIMDQVKITVGFREFLTKAGCFYLNGEQVRLCGTEWMPGSDPGYGMAEPVEQLEKMLTCLKESNCVFTRFHWQQDEAVFDWCDRHGMLVQEEIPYWGADPAEAGETQWNVFTMQFQEMLQAHRNHPSIIAWGVGNELDGKSEKTKAYIRRAIDYAHRYDRSRTANYVSNTCYYEPVEDGTLLGDIKMINEYTGTWMTECEADEVVRNTVEADSELPLVISEYGLCEPVFPGGDERRGTLFEDKMAVYRKYPNVAGTINFCLNDYRTQMGEEGEGKMRRRVHGSTELDGTPKPSYYILQRECAPFQITWSNSICEIRGRENLPCYTMNGYQLHFLDASGKEIARQTLDTLAPGETKSFDVPQAKAVEVRRMNGDWAGTFSYE